jgi:hypothetical protein
MLEERQPAAEIQIARMRCCGEIHGLSRSDAPSLVRGEIQSSTEGGYCLLSESGYVKSEWTFYCVVHPTEAHSADPRRTEPRLGHKDLCKFLLPAITATLFSVSATAQTSAFGPAPFAPNSETTDSFKLAPRFDVTNLPPGMFGTDSGGSAAQQGEQSEGVVKAVGEAHA